MTNKDNKRVLVIVESPNKIKTLKGILPKNYVIMASVGHITRIANEGFNNLGIDVNGTFKAKYVIDADKKDVFNKLKAQVEYADLVVLATDGDREGEAIAWSLRDQLKIPKAKCKRAVFQELTKKAVLKAFDNLTEIDEELVKAAQARQKLDKIVGFTLSPVARREVNAKSVGRCQSAGLKLITDREKEIQEFIPVTFFELFLNFSKNNTDFVAKYIGTNDAEEKRIDSLDRVKEIVTACKKKDTYLIKDVEVKERVSNPRDPFTTSTFQQEVSNRLGIGVKSSMAYAQKLFEGISVGGEHIALITYIRTDSTEFSPEFLPELESYVKGTYGDAYYSPVRKGKVSENAQEGHEAIRPVDLTMTPEKLSTLVTDGNLVKVYDIIYKRTVATAMASSITNETIYTIHNNNHLFTLSSKELAFDGYKVVYGVFEDKGDETVLETFVVKEQLQNTSLESVEKTTRPPARYKEATFIKELEKQGIGRPSTFVSIVETILSPSRGYSQVESKNIIPTSKGMELSRFLDKAFPDIININYTSEMEGSLDKIASGKLNDVKFLTDFYKKLDASIQKVSPTIDKKCPDCGKQLVVRKGRFGMFLGCTGYPSCTYVEKMPKASK